MVGTVVRTLGIGAVIAFAVTLSACSSGGSAARSSVDDAALVGTWTIDASFTSPEQPFIAFDKGGSWIASDGCNRVQGTWKLGDKGALTTTSGPSTLMACDGAQLPLAVSRADYVQVAGDALTITSSSDSTSTALVRSTDPKVGPQDRPVGQWIESTAPDSAYLTLAADGTANGSDGCNTLIGTWSTKGDGTIAFGTFASTRKFCEGVNDWLGRAATASVLSGVMTIQDATGEVLGQLSSK